MPPIKTYSKPVMKKSDIDKLLSSPDKRREAWLEYMTEPAAAATPPRPKSPQHNCLSDKERAAIDRKYTQVLQQHGITSIMLRHSFTPVEMGGPSLPLPASPRTRMASVLHATERSLAEGDVQVRAQRIFVAIVIFCG
jgi:hypothetical protein